MKFLYRISFYSIPATAIVRVRVLAEENGSITVESGHGERHTEMLGSERHCYRDTFGEARQVLIDRAQNDAIQHELFARRARAAVSAYSTLREPA